MLFESLNGKMTSNMEGSFTLDLFGVRAIPKVPDVTPEDCQLINLLTKQSSINDITPICFLGQMGGINSNKIWFHLRMVVQL